MIRNFLRVAVRNLLKNKVYVIINTFGMGVAMACTLAAYLLIAYNIEFDEYYSDELVGNVVKVIENRETLESNSELTLKNPIVMAPLAAREIAGIENFTRFTNQECILSSGENAFHENVRFADASFLKMFQQGLVKGSYKNFDGLQSIYLSETMARKYFADGDPIGEAITTEINGKKYDVVVGGVFQRIPLNTSFQIDALLRIEIYLEAYNIGPDQWESNQDCAVLFKLSGLDQREQVTRQMDKYIRLQNEKRRDTRVTSFELIPYKSAIVKSEVRGTNLRMPIPRIALVIFSTMGLIILLIACFNLTNTTMALTGKRLKEIGVRKVIGSARIQIVYQFLFEMIVTLLLAMIAGILLAQIIVPQFALLWQMNFGLEDLNGLNMILALTMLLFSTAILAGLYPAIVNSKYSPILLLKGQSQINATSPLTRVLLVLQFSLSVVVLIAGIVFTQNAAYQKTMSLGYDKEKLLVVSVKGEAEYNQLKNVVSQNPKVSSIEGAGNHIGPYSAMYSTMKIDTSLFKTNIYNIGPAYFGTVGLSVIVGRNFMEGSQADIESSAIVDQNFITNHKIANALDSKIYLEDKPYYVVGIVNNHLSGLKQSDNSEHVYFLAQPSQFSSMIIRSEADLTDVRQDVEREWKRLFPGKPFKAESQVDIIYEEANGYNKNLKLIFFFLTVLGSLLSATGIFALGSLNVQKRTREIGVRKVLGASALSIIRLLNREFGILLPIAALAGGAGGYFLTTVLMESLYAQHIAVGIETVLFSGTIIVVLGLLTTSGTIFKAANSNPTETLRAE